MKELNYFHNRLPVEKQEFVEKVMEYIFEAAKGENVPLLGDDRCVETRDAIAKLVFESQPMADQEKGHEFIASCDAMP